MAIIITHHMTTITAQYWASQATSIAGRAGGGKDQVVMARTLIPVPAPSSTKSQASRVSAARAAPVIQRSRRSAASASVTPCVPMAQAARISARCPAALTSASTPSGP